MVYTIVKHIDSWGWSLTWAVECNDVVIVYKAKTQKECKEWAISNGIKFILKRSKVVKKHNV